jgi:hypothetical protein
MLHLSARGTLIVPVRSSVTAIAEDYLRRPKIQEISSANLLRERELSAENSVHNDAVPRPPGPRRNTFAIELTGDAVASAATAELVKVFPMALRFMIISFVFGSCIDSERSSF